MNSTAKIEMEALALLQESNPVMWRFMGEDARDAFRKKLHDLRNKIKQDSNLAIWLARSLNYLSAGTSMSEGEKEFLAYHNEQIAKSQNRGYFSKLHKRITQDPFGAFVSFLVSANEFRLLQVVWGLSTLDYLVKSFGDSPMQAHTADALTAAGDVLGNISWILYFVRFFGNFLKAISSGIRNATEEEQAHKVPWYKREALKEAFSSLKYSMENDLRWGGINWACFKVLLGCALLDYANNTATAFLLVGDCVSVWLRVREETIKAQKEINEINKELQKLIHTHLSIIDKIAEEEKKLQLARRENNLEHIQRINRFLKSLRTKHLQALESIAEEENKLQQAQFEMRYETQYKGLIDKAYASVLVLTWSAMCAFFVNTPVSLSLASKEYFMVLPMQHLLTINLAGAIGCFAISILYGIAMGLTDVMKTKKSITLLHEEALHLINVFVEIKKQSHPEDEKQLKGLYLKIQGLMNKAEEKGHLVPYYWARLARLTVFDVLLPMVLIAAVVVAPPTFLGIPIMLVLLGVGLSLASLSKPLFETVYHCVAKAKKPAFVPWQESKYRSFSNNVDQGLDHFRVSKNPNGFLAPRRTLTVTRPLLEDYSHASSMAGFT